MPNWVRNKITFYGPQNGIDELKEFVSTGVSLFDFNQICPMPISLNNIPAEEEVQECAIACFKARENDLNTCDEYEKRAYGFDFQELVSFGKTYEENVMLYGFRDWYHWRLSNWGTKWNSVDASWEGNECTFDTAWSIPQQIYERLARTFPYIMFDVLFADEDLGRNCGTVHYSGDESSVVVNYIDELDFARDVWGTTSEEDADMDMPF